MPKLRKFQDRDQFQDQQSFGKYLTFEEKQTQIPQPIHQEEQRQNLYERSQQKKAAQGKKSKRSLKKQKNNDLQEILQTQKTAKRKSRKKKVDQSPQKTEDQNQQVKQLPSPQQQVKQKSLRKNNKSSKKSKVSQNQYHKLNKNEDDFIGNQLRQKEEQKDNQNQVDEQLKKEESQKSLVNFNKRLKKKKQTEKEDLNVLFSRYTEDQSSNAIGNRGTSDNDSCEEIGTRFESDLRDLDLLVKKKMKKQKKEKEIKIKNKYFSDISMSESYETSLKLEGQDPPQNNEQLIIEKRQPRKTIHNLNQVIEKRINHIKDRREFKNSEGDMRFKNHLKNKLQQVKDVEQVQVDIEIPNLFTKKTASAALFMKNALQAEEKKINFSQTNSKNENKLQNTSSSLPEIKTQETLGIQQKKHQEFLLQMKKKGVNRNQFFDHLNKEIKSKRHTEIGSQQIKDCFKTSSLNEQNFDLQLADGALSNCSSRSDSQQSSSRFERLKRTDSQKNLKSQQHLKECGPQIQQSKDFLTGSISRSSSKWNIEMNGRNGESSNSKSIVTNRSSKHIPFFINPPISQVKQSDASNSIKQIDGSCISEIKSLVHGADKSLMRFDGQQIKEEVQKSFQKTLKIFQSENQFQIENNADDGESTKKKSQIKTTNEILEDQKESDKKLEQKLKKIIKKTNEKKPKLFQEKCLDGGIDDMFGDNLNEENSQRHERRKKKKLKRNKKKKSKQGFQLNDYESYFEVEAEYSSDEQGHSDSQCQSVDSDLDEEGNIIGLIDKDTDGLKINQRKVKRKFLEDEEKKDKEMIEKIMKGIYGRKKLEQTESEKRLKKRMEQAAKKNLLDDLEQINGKDKSFLISDHFQQPYTQVQKMPQKQNQNEQNSRQMKKLKEMEELLSIRNHRNLQNQNFNGRDSTLNEPWKIINPSLPVRKTIIPSNMSGKRMSVDKNKQHRKLIFDTKKGIVQQEIFNKTIQTDRPRVDSTGNRNKLQKTSQIRLDIRNTNIKLDEDIQI